MNNEPVVRICCAQIAGIWEEPVQSLNKIIPYIRCAASSGADIICFPEQFATGWDPRSRSNSQDIHGSIVATLRTLAKENNIAILGSFRQQSDPFPKNTSIVIASDGQILETYAKMHLFSPAGEQDRFLPGNALGIFPLGLLTCGIAICYDLRFPDLFRIYASRGVQAVFVPAAWPSTRIRQWEIFITARAAENQIYVVGVNTTGTTLVDTYNGHSMTADPHGAIIQRATEEEQLLFADLDPAVLETARCSLPIEKDRRDDVYRSLRNPEQV